MKLTKQQLKEKIWFRALKVLFIILFLLTQCVVLFYSWNTEKVSMIKCNNGKEFENTFSVYSFSITMAEKFAIEEECDASVQHNVNSNVKNFSSYYKDKYALFGKIEQLIIPFIIVSIIFWVISRMFYYIVLGESFFKQFQKDEFSESLKEFNEELHKKDK